VTGETIIVDGGRSRLSPRNVVSSLASVQPGKMYN
jgi:hypothetical protein